MQGHPEDQFLHDILDRITDGFYALDQNWNIVYWNKAAESMLGKTREEVRGKNIWEVFPDARDMEYYNHYKRAFDEQITVGFEQYYPPFDIWNEISVYPSKNGLSIYFKNITERKQFEHKIRSAIINAQEREREIIGRELHDNVNQVLTSVKLYNEICLTSKNPKDLLKKSIGMLQQSIEDIRGLSKRLSVPTTISSGELTDSILELVKKFRLSRQFDIHFFGEKITNDINITHDQHLCLYRILQEHLTNISKHAKASMVRIELFLDHSWLTMKVTDNGIGFDTTGKYSGIGIDNMKARAENINGSFKLNSIPGQGCQLEVRVPYLQME